MFAKIKSYAQKTRSAVGEIIGELQPNGVVKVTAGGALVTLGASAHAALPEGVGTAITAAQTDMLAAIGLVIGAMVAVWGLLKLASKLGWR